MPHTEHARDEPAPGPFIFASAEQGAADFTGRDHVLDQVVDWMDTGSERFLVLIAEPGWGKSSLCAWMIGPGREPEATAGKARHAQLREAWSAAYLCSAMTHSTVLPATFARSIAAQLAHRFDDFAEAFLRNAAPGQVNVSIKARDITGRAVGILTEQINVEAPDAGVVYEDSVRRPLAEIAATHPGDDPIFILVDGLDDALAVASPTIVDLLAASTDLPTRVRFLLTSRREDRVLLAFPESRGDVRMIALSGAAADNDRDVRAYIEWRASEPKVAAWATQTGLGPAAFTDALVEHADGNFLFIRFVLDNPPPVGVTEAIVPAGLQAAYDAFLVRVLPELDDYGTDPAWTDEVRPVLGALTVAVPAAPLTVLPRWLGPDVDIADALRRVGQLTEWVADDGGSRRLYHRSLGDFLATESLPPVAGEPLANRFFVRPLDRHRAIVDAYVAAITADWDGDWSRCDAYGLRRLIPHLHAIHGLTAGHEQADVARQICDLALDPGFQAAQRAMPDGAAATIEAIRLALEVSATSDDAAAIRERVHTVASSWEPEMRASAARAIAKLHGTNPTVALDEMKALLR